LARTAFGRQPNVIENARFIKRNQANVDKEILTAVALAIDLSASIGFRVFSLCSSPGSPAFWLAPLPRHNPANKNYKSCADQPLKSPHLLVDEKLHFSCERIVNMVN